MLKIITLILTLMVLSGCASLGAGLQAMGQGLSQNNTTYCNTSGYGHTYYTSCR